MIKIPLILAFFILLSCYPKPLLEIHHDDFDGSLTYSLDNNKIISKDPIHEIELNLQKRLTNNKSEYLIILECIGSQQIGLTDSTKITFLIDGEKKSIIPSSIDPVSDIDPELFLETIHVISNFKFIKKIAYSNQIEIKIEGDRKNLYSKLGLENKIYLQEFIKSFISLDEQVRAY